jgi:serine/threonine-protein kinase RsbW
LAGGVLITMSAIDIRRLTLRNELVELERLAGWLESWTKQDVSSDLSLAVQLCLEEVVANVIMHGAAEDTQLEITVDLEQAPGTLVARIEDNGREFDPTRAPPPTVGPSLDELNVTNLGIHLVRSFADGMEYERRDNHNQLVLRFTEPDGVLHCS